VNISQPRLRSEKFDNNNNSNEVLKASLPYSGTYKCEPTELFLTINRISKSMIIKKEHAC